MKFLRFIKQKIFWTKDRKEQLELHFKLEDLASQMRLSCKNDEIENRELVTQFFNDVIDKRKNLYIYPLK